MAEINLTAATYDQIATVLSKLATNYSNIASKFYDIFYNTTPMDVTIQLYDEAGVLTTYVIPNRAKDFTYVLNGTVEPEGVASASVGAIYQDTVAGSLYIKRSGTGFSGWEQIYSGKEIIEGEGSPEEIVTADRGTLYKDNLNAALYIKTTVIGNTGWTIISATTTSLADRDLSNLTDTGEAHFANPSLSNLNDIGEALLNSKENIANKLKTTAGGITSSSTDDQYPSAKATYQYGEAVKASRADKDLSNLTTSGNYKILPSHGGNNNKYLQSNGEYGVWVNPEDRLAKKDLSNVTGIAQVRVVVEAAKSGNRWYRVYDDKWCEQGGWNYGGTVTLSKAYSDGSYTILTGSGAYGSATSGSQFYLSGDSWWATMGYIP